jgi:hypothetical protein
MSTFVRVLEMLVYFCRCVYLSLLVSPAAARQEKASCQGHGVLDRSRAGVLQHRQL